MRPFLPFLPFLILTLGACMRGGPPKTATPETPALHAEAIAGVEDGALASLLHDSWEHTMAESPVWASMLGDDRYADQLGDNSETAMARRLAATEGFLKQAEGLDPSGMNASDQLSLSLFIHSLAQDRAEKVCLTHTWSLSARRNPVVEFNTLPENSRHDTPESRVSLLARYAQLPGVIHNEIGHLRRGISDGRVVTLESVSRVIEITQDQLVQPTEDWPLLAFLDEPMRFETEAFMAQVDGPIRQALASYLLFLKEELSPVAREGENIGMSGMPDGAACYQTRVRRFTSLALSPDEIHQIGLDELGRIHKELAVLGERVLGTSQGTEIADILRIDPQYRFESSAEVQEAAEVALQRATAAMPEWFGRLPEADCVVVPIPDYEAPYTTIAYYRQATETKPGEYFINTHAPETRPRFEAEVLAWHEAIPGHHLQIAIARELDALPAFRRYMESTPFVEGWALYTERLADEMGLYSSDLDRIGMLSFDLWRASRLVVDTGIHAKGWSRQQAIQFMLDHTILAPNNIDNEVDRYISWPGQALGYKLGQLTFSRLRYVAEERLGEQFDIREFHDLVLGGGALPLDILEQRVMAWIESHEESP